MARTKNRRTWKLTALMAFGGMAWRMWRSRSAESRAGAHMDKPKPELRPEPAPGPDVAGGEAEAASESAKGTTAGHEPTSTPGHTPLSEPDPDRAPDEPASTQDQKVTPGREPDPVDEAEYESFPASDPPSWTR